MRHFQMKPIKIVSHDTVFINRVFAYYKKHGRHDLPWRARISPYRILVSEIMLQQTQVSRVVPKFELWMKKYPSLSVLRKASFRDILVLWQGLGYQRRAKSLHAIAKAYTTVPTSFKAIISLPGVGKYTASAVCAFAYNAFTYPMLETNIRTALIEEYHSNKIKIHDGELYNDLSRLEKNKHVQKMGARVWYYALMDYGAHLKVLRISHNEKSAHHTKQSPYKGSIRELRAKILFAVTHGTKLPRDKRVRGIAQTLVQENYLMKKGKGYIIS